jgi:alkylation response protein AidB-like acyl-CoA dehydrogenase
MSATDERLVRRARPESLEAAIDVVRAGAEAGDRSPGFPAAALSALEAAGALAITVPGPSGRRAVGFAEEWTLVRRVSAADGSVGRILDGHLNAVERIAAAPEPLRGRELRAVAAGRARLGVWGADPAPGEGAPARLSAGRAGPVIVGVKVFCSGAGGLDRALVTAVDGEGARRLAYVALDRGVDVDRGWFRGAGLRASESHLVRFRGAAVLGVIGGPDELLREPEFGRDAIRTAACWAGIADAAAAAALDAMSARGAEDELTALAAGRIVGARETMDRWLGEAAARADADPGASLYGLSVHLRAAVAAAARQVLDEAARALGSRPFAQGGTLDRARRDLDLFLLQHRLDPLVAREGRRAIEERR